MTTESLDNPYDILSATIDNEYSAEQIEQAAKQLNIAAADVLKKKESAAIIDYLMACDS